MSLVCAKATLYHAMGDINCEKGRMEPRHNTVIHFVCHRLIAGIERYNLATIYCIIKIMLDNNVI